MRAAAAGANGFRFWGVYGVLHIRRRRNVRGRDVVFTSLPGGFGRSAGLPVAYGIRVDLRPPVRVWLWLRVQNGAVMAPPDGGPLRAYRLAVGRGRADGEKRAVVRTASAKWMPDFRFCGKSDFSCGSCANRRIVV